MRAKGVRVLWLILVVAAIAYGLHRVVLPKSQEVRQPIRFNHRKHIEGGMECTGCHQSAKEQMTAGMPNTALCMVCHEASVTQSPEARMVREYAQRGEEIPWRRLAKLPEHVYFSHRRHAGLERLDCSRCHESIARSGEPPSRPIQFSMAGCLACHEAKKAATDCLACHK